MIRVYHAQSHVVPNVLTSRHIQTYNSLGTWFDSDPAIARQLYGRNVVAYDIPDGPYLESADDLAATLGHNLPLIGKVFGPDAAEHLQRYPWDTQAQRRWAELERSGDDARLLRTLRRSREIVQQALLSPQYCQAFRHMIEDAGYRGLVWRQSNIDGAGPHDVYLLFHAKDVQPVTLIEAKLEFRQVMSSMDRAEMFLQAKGFRSIGSGASADVYTHPNFAYVLKVFDQDSCYNNFCYMVSQNQANPHFPKFRGQPMRIYDEIYAVRIERLSALPETQWGTMIANYIESVIDGYKIEDSQIQRQYPKLKAACILVRRLIKVMGGECEGDFKAENIMMRGNIPVIIDPVYDPSLQ